MSVQSTDVPQQPTTPPRLPKELDLHPEFVSLLGVDPNTANSQDTSLKEHLVKRWSSYATKGLPKEIREGLAARWQVASNCPHLQPPKINPEVDVLLNHIDKKKDGFLGTLQEKISRSLTVVGTVIQNVGSNQQLLDARPRPYITGLRTPSLKWSFLEEIPGGHGNLKFLAPSTGHYDETIHKGRPIMNEICVKMSLNASCQKCQLYRLSFVTSF